MVYILPALIRTAIAEHTLGSLMLRSRAFVPALAEAAQPLLPDSLSFPDVSLVSSHHFALVPLLKLLYREPRHRLCAFIFTWGVASGVLSVSVTALKQIGIIN